MWNAEIINKDVDVVNQTVIVLVRFTTAGKAYDKKIGFGPTVTLEEVKRRIKQEIVRLETTDASEDAITLGAVDLTGVTTQDVVTQDELDKQTWFRDFERLQKAQKLIDLGVTLTAQQNSALNNLRTQVGTNFKTIYFNDM